MIPPELIPLVSALIVGVANFTSILLAYWRMERRIDKKIEKYWTKVKASEEGQDLFTLLKEAKKLVKGEETQKLFKEAYAVLEDVRVILEKIREKVEVNKEEGTEEDVEDFPVLPSFG